MCILYIARYIYACYTNIIKSRKEDELMGKTYSEAQAKATKEYLKTLASISIRVKEEEKEKYADAAQKAGMSLRAFILKSMDEKIERDSL